MHLRLASKPLASALRAGQRLERRLNPVASSSDAAGWEPPSVRNGGSAGWNGSEKEKRRSASPGHEDDRYDRRR